MRISYDPATGFVLSRSAARIRRIEKDHSRELKDIKRSDALLLELDAAEDEFDFEEKHKHAM
jgi:hypothetical protein